MSTALPLQPIAFAVRPRSAQDQVLHDLGLAILRGDYPEDSLLPSEAELGQRYAVSRTVLREVIKTLAAKGLVLSRTKVGTRVRPQVDWNFFDADFLNWRLELGFDQRFLESLYEIRFTVEPAAASLAALKRTEADVVALKGLIADMRQPSHSRVSFAAVDLALHLRIAGASGNPFMRAIGNIIEAVLIRTLTETTPSESDVRLAATAESHALIVDAIIAGDPEAASRAMVTVIAEGRRNRMAALNAMEASA